MDNQKEAIRDARKLGIPKMLLLGFQHMFAMFGATILVTLLITGFFVGLGFFFFVWITVLPLMH